MVIDEEWARFLAENKFLVGLSLDGPKDIHDSYRAGPNGKGSFIRIMETVNHFNKYKVEYNILSVVTAHSARHINKIYNFLRNMVLGIFSSFHVLIPLENILGDMSTP